MQDMTMTFCDLECQAYVVGELNSTYEQIRDDNYTIGSGDSILDYEDNNESYQTWEVIAIAGILLCLVVGTIVGNILVCVAVCLVRKLRRPCNYLLVSLAVSDLCVATLVMPMALLYEVLGEWRFGATICDIWVSFDVLSCTASILNLCMISVDRYYAITKPLEYGVKRTPKRMIICVSIVWISAGCISVPPLLIMGNEYGANGRECGVSQNFWYQIYATFGSFYIPLSVMMIVYYRIFRAARKIVGEEKRAQAHFNKLRARDATSLAATSLTDIQQTSVQFSNVSQENLCAVTEITRNGTSTETKVFTDTPNFLPSPKSAKKWLELKSCGSGYNIDSRKQSKMTFLTDSDNNYHSKFSSAFSLAFHKKSPTSKTKLRFVLAKERKASTTLGIIMSAFTVCWLPFFVLALIRPFTSSDPSHTMKTLSSLFLWLGYANSLLNPIIYATLNKDFRKPFREILCFRCQSLNVMMREEFYHSQYGDEATTVKPVMMIPNSNSRQRGMSNETQICVGLSEHASSSAEQEINPLVPEYEETISIPRTFVEKPIDDIPFGEPVEKIHPSLPEENYRDMKLAMLCGPQRESFL